MPTNSLHYGVAKTAVLSLSRGLAKVARGSGVTVNAVLPGVTMTEWVEVMMRGLAEQRGQSFEEAGVAAVKARYPTSIDQRIHTVEEVANLVVYACSMQASATTGSALRRWRYRGIDCLSTRRRFVDQYPEETDMSGAFRPRTRCVSCAISQTAPFWLNLQKA